MADRKSRSSRAITLTLLATVTATSLSACGRSKKDVERARLACQQDPQSEDCLSGGRSHSSMSYFFFGSGSYGQPTRYATPYYSPLYNSDDDDRRRANRPIYSGGGTSSGTVIAPGRTTSGGGISSFSSGSAGGASSGSVASEGGGFSAGSVSTGGFGASAAGHAGGGGGGE